MSINKLTDRIVRCAGYQWARVSVVNQAEVFEKSSAKLQEINALDLNSKQCFSSKIDNQKIINNNKYQNIKIATLNIRTLLCDIKN